MKVRRKRYVIDASAYMAYLQDEPGAARLQTILEDADMKKVQLYMSVIHYGEVFYSVEHKNGGDARREVEEVLHHSPIHVEPVSLAQTRSAALLKSRDKRNIGYADAFAVALALEKKAILLAKDKDFTVFEEDIELEWLDE